MDVTTWYLEMTDPARLRPARYPAVPARLVRAEIPSPELNRFLYTSVGGGHAWTDRLEWSRLRWLEWLERPAVETWVLHVRGTPAGYAELDPQAAGTVEIAYFGLLPAFVGRGLGGHLLSAVLERAWTLDARWEGREPTRRVWLHTCTLDGEYALANYRARGLSVYRTETGAGGPDSTA